MDESDRAGHRTQCCWPAGAWAVADDRSTWRALAALRPTAGYAQHWLTDCVSGLVCQSVYSPSLCLCSSLSRSQFYRILTKSGTDAWNMKQRNHFVPVKIQPAHPRFGLHFTPNWHFHNAHSMGARASERWNISLTSPVDRLYYSSS